MFTSHVIQQNVFLVFCLRIWWRHGTLIFLRTKRPFEVKQKTFFLVSQVLSFSLKLVKECLVNNLSVCTMKIFVLLQKYTIHSGVAGSKPGQVLFQDFWAQTLAWINKKLVLLLWYISYNWYWSDYEIYRDISFHYEI